MAGNATIVFERRVDEIVYDLKVMKVGRSGILHIVRDDISFNHSYSILTNA
jgi:hypothetical protein